MQDRARVKLLRSSGVTEDNSPLLPASSALTDGEIAMNFRAGKECLAIKNSDGEIATFYKQVYLGKTGDTIPSEFTPDIVVDDGTIYYKDETPVSGGG